MCHRPRAPHDPPLTRTSRARALLIPRPRVPLRAAALTALAALCCIVPAAAQAQSCEHEELRAAQPHGLELPDCRAYEQVSPVAKNGVDAIGGTGADEASPTGASVTFGSIAPLPQATGSFGGSPLYLSARAASPEEWSTFGLTPPHEPTAGNGGLGEAYVSGWTEDLAKTIVASEEVLAPEATPEHENAYVRDNNTGAFQLLTTDPGNFKIYYADATPGGSHIIFETQAALSVGGGPQPAPGVTNLYEWDETKPPGGRVSLLGILPASEGGEVPTAGAHAIPTQHAISNDGSRAFFTDAGTGRLYMRSPLEKPAATTPISPGAVSWQAATPDGSFVFYAEGSELYRFNVDGFQSSAEPEPEALAEAREQLTTGAEGVQGLGVSNDGTYAYFIAPGVLAANRREYRNPEGNLITEEAEPGARNLYRFHEGEASPSFIARVGSEQGQQRSGGARLTPDGRTLLFGANAALTGYTPSTNCEGDAAPCWEFFRYSSDSGRVSCVSCDPATTTVTREPSLSKADNAVVGVPHPEVDRFQTRNLSDDGARVFFETPEALLPQDGNNQFDVYEWEAEGAGSCTPASETFATASGGCLYLISTGQSGDQSTFADASSDGSSAFFLTRQSLVGQDQDDNQDLYDARTDGGIPSQNQTPAPSCAGDACRGATEASPAFAVSTSGSLAGSGNLTPPAPPAPPQHPKCAKPKKIIHGKCVTPKRRCARGRKPHHGRCVKTARARGSSVPKAGKRTGGHS